METAAGIVKRKFVLEGLDCANCAMKIENGVQNIDGVSACSVNFVNKTLTMEMVMDRSEEILEQTKKKIRALEPDVKVLEQGAAGIKRAHNHGHSRGHDHDHADDRGAEAAEDGHGHSHDHGAQSLKIMVARLAAGFVIGAAALSLSLGQELKLILFLASYLVGISSTRR